MKTNSRFMSSFITPLLLAIVLGMGAGCARKPDDAKISSEVQSKFSQDSGLASKQLSVKAEEGVVTLAGSVDNDAQRDAAGRQAASNSRQFPRIRDFRGISGKSFDGRGNYNMGVKEQIIFPEIEYEKIDALRGMNITITTSAKTDEEAKALLLAFKLPLKK